ncbi:class I SAM-dependent methyltransferase [Vibrio tubiashii]|uniref:class I SAM-dependent methyltransferase n=2 Tax=Vibrio tubiashii TaxID=29498 RepID=UPI001EFC7B1E|nr:class I SAM-dependent methyltransferase [Vibrio tubiashii]MCG9584135.1 class I SAM-dependent methyltransferase [Vibrio tubiashii]MCG9617730.1 class I SAM-dependent methyltransferase [Vibrio tubiashii]
MLKNKLDESATAYSNSFAYELDNSLMLNWYPKRVVKNMVKGTLLELGVGHGYSCRQFANQVDEYTILDGSPAVIAQFRENNPDLNHIKIVETYFETFDTQECFDNIVMGFVLEHVEDPEQILKKYRPLLSENGRLFISVPNAGSLHRQLAHIAGMLPDLEQLSESDLELGHVRYFTVDTLKALVESCGYEVVNVEGLFLKPFTTSQITSLNLDDKIFNALMEKGIDYPELSTGFLLEAKLG